MVANRTSVSEANGGTDANGGGIQWTTVIVALIGLLGALVGSGVTYLATSRQNDLTQQQLTANSDAAQKQFEQDHTYEASRSFLRQLSVIERAQVAGASGSRSAQQSAGSALSDVKVALGAATKDKADIDLVSRGGREAETLLLSARALARQIKRAAAGEPTPNLLKIKTAYGKAKADFLVAARQELGTGEYAAAEAADRRVSSLLSVYFILLFVLLAALALATRSRRRHR